MTSPNFRERLRNGEPMMGTFLKTPSAIVCEVLGLTPLACVCIDAEHAPFGRMELDSCLAALRAAGMPSLVRVQTGTAGEILGALDSGATGVVLPHVITGAQAAEAVRLAHYSSNGRGYAGSSRAAGYTTKSMAMHLSDSAASTTVIAQIEDREALPHLDAIASTEGIDCLFVGRMDLTLSLGASSPLDPIVLDAVEQICAAGQRHGKAVGMFVPAGESCADWQRKGATLFLLASDQQFMIDGAHALMSKIAAPA
ncbi:MAG: aldolase/citrate lyase family protein [Pseudomonadota bacterium]